MADTPIKRAIAELLAERQHVAARLQKLDAAIATLRDTFHLPAEARAARAARAPRAARGSAPASPRGENTSIDDIADDAIRNALEGGPIGVAELARRLKCSRLTVRRLVHAGRVIGHGKTAARVFSLPTPAAARRGL